LYIKNGTVLPTASSSQTSTASSASVSGTAPSSTSSAPVVIPTGAFTSMGCYTDDIVTARTLVDATTAGSSMSVEVCAAFCSKYTYFGVEYADECYCSNTIASTGVPATDGRCSMACAGNSAEMCGGSYGLNMYMNTPSSTTSSAALSTTSTSASSVQVSTTSSVLTTSTSSTSATPTPSIPATVGAYTYLHCHSDNTTIRTLQSKYIAKADMTIEHCAGNCTGYLYFGVEYSQECYCSNTLTFGSYIATDGRCNMLCKSTFKL
jgi:hypothetical protein